VNERPGRGRNRSILPEQYLDDPFDPRAETQCRQFGAAKHADEFIVSSAASDTVLRAELFGDYFEYRPVVVIKASDNFAVDDEGDAQQGKALLHFLEVAAAIVA